MLKLVVAKSKLWLLIIFVATVSARLLLTNINSAEWGDSYRILRASNFIQNLSYPADEKRPPLFSALLAIRSTNIDAVLWGRLFMLVTSSASYFVFYKLCQKYLPTQNQRLLALIFFFLNPVYLYWSLRIYADVPFSLLVMLCFYVFELWREKQKDREKTRNLYPIVMGVLCGLSILTRFEGYLLTLATAIGVVASLRGALATKRSQKDCFVLLAMTLIPFLLALAVVVIPWLIYRNPLTSSYFEEPAGRTYNFEMLLTYLVSYLFVLGIIPAFALIIGHFLKRTPTKLLAIVKNYPHILSFVFLESLLILAWPAAVPRLFVPIIPFLIIALVKSLKHFQPSEVIDRSSDATTNLTKAGVGAVVLTAIYIVVQYKLRLQFLGPHSIVFIFISATSLVSTLSIFFSWKKLFMLSAVLSMIALAASTIYLHKDVYRSIKEISIFSLREPAGKVIHNDTAGIVGWYFPKSDYKNLDDKKYLTQEYLAENQVGYIILTNEFNPNLEIDLKKRPYLNLIKESKYERGGKIFFTWLVGVQK